MVHQPSVIVVYLFTINIRLCYKFKICLIFLFREKLRTITLLLSPTLKLYLHQEELIGSIVLIKINLALSMAKFVVDIIVDILGSTLSWSNWEEEYFGRECLPLRETEIQTKDLVISSTLFCHFCLSQYEGTMMQPYFDHLLYNHMSVFWKTDADCG